VGQYESQPANTSNSGTTSNERLLPKTGEDHQNSLRSPVIQPENPHFLNVAVIGAPNAGKSTLTNFLIGTKVSAVSKKVHTTRRNVIGTLVHESTQIVFSDSPGLVTKSHCAKHNLEFTFMTQPVQSITAADLIMAVVDASNPRERKCLGAGVIEKLSQFPDKPSILVLNKVDCIKSKRKLFDISIQLTGGMIANERVAEELPRTLIHAVDQRKNVNRLMQVEQRIRQKGYICDLPKIDGHEPEPEIDLEELEPEVTSWPNFSHVFMVSALTGDGVDDLKNFLFSSAKPGEWKFPADVITTQKPETLVMMTVKEKLLDHLEREIPYVIQMRIVSWCVMRTGTLCIQIDLLVPKRRYVSQVLGENGSFVAKIANDSRQEISNMFQCDVSLKIVVKCNEMSK
jgi:small GTP-binding protein